MQVSSAIQFLFKVHEQPFCLISIGKISSDAESHEEQDGTNRFQIEETIAEFQPKKEEESFFVTLSVSDNGCFYQSCSRMQPLESKFNGELHNHI